MNVWLCFFSFIIISLHGMPELQFSPSNNITVLQSAEYKCSIHNIAMSVSWKINNISSGNRQTWDEYLANNSISVKGLDTMSSTVTIPGDPLLNETTIQCFGTGNISVMSDTVTLYIQGQPNKVDLKCSVIYFGIYTIECNWLTPYTVNGIHISGYMVNISDGNATKSEEMNGTEFAYYDANKCGNYTISVMSYIQISEKQRLEGNNSTVIKTAPCVKVNNWFLNLSYNKNHLMEVTIVLKEDIFYKHVTPKQITLLMTCQSNSSKLHFILNYNQSGIYQTILSDVDRRKCNASILLEYKNGLQIDSNQSKFISTFDVQNVTISKDCNKHECIHITYISGLKNPPGFFVEFGFESGVIKNLSINGLDETCINVNLSSNYTISVYDIVNGTPFTTEPAFTTFFHANPAVIDKSSIKDQIVMMITLPGVAIIILLTLVIVVLVICIRVLKPGLWRKITGKTSSKWKIHNQ